MEKTLPIKFENEKLASHWKVTKERKTFERLMWHLQVRTHFYFGFMQSINSFFEITNIDNLVIADIGGGVGWCSALLAKDKRVKKVYLIEPSVNRTNSFKNICHHLEVESTKVQFIEGSFQNLNLPEKVDVFLMCASIHHCRKDYLDMLFDNIEKYISNKSRNASIIISNEHYVNFIFSISRLISLIINLLKGKKSFWKLSNLRHHDPNDHEHWRTKDEIIKIFKKYNYKYRFFNHDLDLTNDKPWWKIFLAWRYYYAILGK